MVGCGGGGGPLSKGTSSKQVKFKFRGEQSGDLATPKTIVDSDNTLSVGAGVSTF